MAAPPLPAPQKPLGAADEFIQDELRRACLISHVRELEVGTRRSVHYLERLDQTADALHSGWGDRLRDVMEGLEGQCRKDDIVSRLPEAVQIRFHDSPEKGLLALPQARIL